MWSEIIKNVNLDGKYPPEEQEKIVHESTENIVCPYCGLEWEDCTNLKDKGTEYIGLCECVCNEKFHLTRSVTVTYTTQKDGE